MVAKADGKSGLFMGGLGPFGCCEWGDWSLCFSAGTNAIGAINIIKKDGFALREIPCPAK